MTAYGYSEEMRFTLAQGILDAKDGDVIWIQSSEERRIITIKIEPQDTELKGRPNSIPDFIIYDEIETQLREAS